MSDNIIIVTGLPRSGTTMVMRMLEAGGIKPYYDQDKPLRWSAGGVDYINHNMILRESDKIRDLIGGDDSWMDECYGKAIKILRPVVIRPPKGRRYKFIYCDRKTKQMAKSQDKYSLRSNKLNRQKLHQLPIAIDAHRREGLKILRGYQKSDLIVVKFENALKNPKGTARRIVKFLKMDLDIDKMASIVWKRPATCLDFMMEEIIYNN